MRLKITRWLRVSSMCVLTLLFTSMLVLSPVPVPPTTVGKTITNESTSGSLLGERHHGLPESYVTSKRPSETKILYVDEVMKMVRKFNKEQVVRNEQTFGPIDNRTVVIAIQVHNRVDNLGHLIESLRQSSGIEKSLLVFSHDILLEEINSIIASIDFAMVTQIFYPHSIQLYPSQFPGQSVDDCLRDEPKAKALARNCSNAAWPDVYGHYREAGYTQTKHHWWWKASRIFDHLNVFNASSGLVLFIEEDHYVAPDFLHVLNLAEEKRRREKLDCDIITLGTYLTTPNYAKRGREMSGSRRIRPLGRSLLWTNYLNSFIETFRKGEILDWFTTKHNMGMAFDVSVWRRLQACRHVFCSVDDYNWDWSLLHVSVACLKPHRLRVMLVSAPRIFHVGECGVHHKTKGSCDVSGVVTKVQNLLKIAKPYLFPSALEIKTSPTAKKLTTPKRNGGWGDHRDHQLCLSFSNQDP